MHMQYLKILAKSPVFGLVTSSLSGIATIRSAGAQKRLIDNFDTHQVYIIELQELIFI